MNNVRFAVAVIVVFLLTQVVRGRDVESFEKGFAPISSTVTEWTMVGEMPSGRNHVKLASAPPVISFPGKLPGNPQEVRNRIAATNGLEAAVFVSAQYPTTGGFIQVRIGKRFDGYPSFNEGFIPDLFQGTDLLIGKIRSATNYVVNGDVWFEVAVTYLNDHSGIPSPLGLSLTRKHGNRNSLNTAQVVESFKSFEVNDFHKLVVLIPPLRQIELTVIDPVNGTKTMSWTKESGVKLAGWPSAQLKPSVTTTYLSLPGELFYGINRMRLTLISSSNDEETYTQFGEGLSSPIRIGIGYGNKPQITGPKGADLVVSSSPDLINWSDVVSVTNSVTPIIVSPPQGPMHFYRATAK